MMIAALLLALAQPAAPADDPISFDIRCMIAAQAGQDATEGPEKAALALAAMFFFGRVDAALRGAALEARIEAEAGRMATEPLGPLMQRCGAFMEERGKAMETIGASLDAKERARSKS